MTLLCDDVRNVLPVLPDASIDCIVSDIPYPTISGGSGPDPKHQRPVGILAPNDGKVFDNNDIDITEYVGEMYRLLVEPGHAWLFSNELNRRRIEDAAHAVGFKTHFLGAWIKNTVTPNRWGMKNGELIFLFRKGKARGLYTAGLKQFIHHPNPRDKTHPTEKPVALMRDLILASSLPGDLVLDPFMGTGATGVAAVQTGRGFIGVEIDRVFFNTAMARITEAKNNANSLPTHDAGTATRH